MRILKRVGGITIGLKTSLIVGELSWNCQSLIDAKVELLDLQSFGQMLAEFSLMVVKANGKRYPIESLMNILMSFQ